MAITDILARGVQFDPVKAYQRGQAVGEDLATSQQNRRIQQQQADLQREKYRAEQQKAEIARGQKYASAIAPILKEIQSVPEDQRQQAYEQRIPTLQEVARTHGIDQSKISTEYDDAKAASVISQFYEPPETREIKKGEQIITEELDPISGEWREIARGPRSAKQRIETTTIEPTKKVMGAAQEGIVDTSTMLDNLFELKTRVTEAPGQLTVWGKAGGGLLKFGERLGVPIPEGGQEYLRTRQGIADYANKVYTTYRRMITGSQASKFELGELKGQAPTLDDSETTMNQKIKDWIADTERLRVRYRKVINDGFTPAGRDDEGNVYFQKNGKKYEVSKIQSLSNIPSAVDRAGQIESELVKNNPDIDDVSLMDLTLQALDNEGYDTRRWKR